jgi:carbon storage regulator
MHHICRVAEDLHQSTHVSVYQASFLVWLWSDSCSIDNRHDPIHCLKEGNAMLVLTRKVGQEIVIGGNIRVTISSIRGDRVRIGISAPPEIRVDREEVHRRVQEFADPAVIACASE